MSSVICPDIGSGASESAVGWDLTGQLVVFVLSVVKASFVSAQCISVVFAPCPEGLKINFLYGKCSLCFVEFIIL